MLVGCIRKTTITTYSKGTKAQPSVISIASKPEWVISAHKFYVFFVYNKTLAQRYYKSLHLKPRNKGVIWILLTEHGRPNFVICFQSLGASHPRLSPF